MTNQEQPNMTPESLEKEADLQHQADQYEKEMEEKIAIANKYGVMDLNKITKEKGQIFIDGLTLQEWVDRDDVSGLPYHRGQK